jgi:hypothetical protein
VARRAAHRSGPRGRSGARRAGDRRGGRARPRDRLGHAARIDDGLLGVTVAGSSIGGGGGRLPQRPWRDWTAPAFVVDADHAVPAGIDGEAAQLEPPLQLRIRAGVLCVRVSRRHPGASPSASLPEGIRQSAGALARIAFIRTNEPPRRSDPWTSSP